MVDLDKLKVEFLSEFKFIILSSKTCLMLSKMEKKMMLKPYLILSPPTPDIAQIIPVVEYQKRNYNVVWVNLFISHNSACALYHSEICFI